MESSSDDSDEEEPEAASKVAEMAMNVESENEIKISTSEQISQEPTSATNFSISTIAAVPVIPDSLSVPCPVSFIL